MESGRASRWASNLLVLAVLAADRLSKHWARTWLAARGGLPVAPFFHLTYLENTGAAFGVMRDSNGFFIILAVALMGGLIVWRRRLPEEDKISRAALSLILAGAAGNLYDRLAYGHVVDFLDFLIWPVFNVADSSISVGACLLALGFWKEGRPANAPLGS